MHLLFPLILVTAALAGACAPSGSERGPAILPADDPAAPLQSLSPAIATIRTAGWWSDAGREGPYRIVITEHGFDHLVSRLYVQWLELVDEEVGLRVLSTVGFDQLNEVPLYQLSILAVREATDELEIELLGFSSYSGEEQRFLVRAGPPGVAALE
jgi:hypothetical protein